MPLILTALLLGVKSAHAAAPVASPPLLSFEELASEEEPEAEENEAEFAEEECEIAKEEFAEGELSKAESEEICMGMQEAGQASGSNTAPEECVLRGIHARLVTDDSPGDVKLTVGYTTYEPTPATVDFSVGGGAAGSLHLGTSKRHLGRSGVIRLSKTLAEKEMAKVDAAGRFTVQIHIPGAPRSCRHFATEQLTVKKASRDQTVWSQPR